MAKGIDLDLDTADLDIIASAAADDAKLVVATTITTITINQGGTGGFRGLTSAQLARYFSARADKGSDI